VLLVESLARSIHYLFLSVVTDANVSISPTVLLLISYIGKALVLLFQQNLFLKINRIRLDLHLNLITVIKL